jgi:hypothetical protein
MASDPPSLVDRILANQPQPDPTLAAVMDLARALDATNAKLDTAIELRKKTGNGNGNGNGKVLDLALKVLTGVTTALLIGTIMWAIGVEQRLKLIEATRFTDGDGRALEERIMSRVPPTWFRDLVAANSATLRDLELRLRQLESRHGGGS